MIGMIIGWTMMGGVMVESAHVHSVHSIREIIVQDCALSLLRLMEGKAMVME